MAGIDAEVYAARLADPTKGLKPHTPREEWMDLITDLGGTNRCEDETADRRRASRFNRLVHPCHFDGIQKLPQQAHARVPGYPSRTPGVHIYVVGAGGWSRFVLARRSRKLTVVETAEYNP